MRTQTLNETAKPHVFTDKWADPKWRETQRAILSEKAKERWAKATPVQREAMMEAQREGRLKSRVSRGMPAETRQFINRFLEGQPQAAADVAREEGTSAQAVQQRLSHLRAQAPQRRVVWLSPEELAMVRILPAEELLERPEALQILERLRKAAHSVQTQTSGPKRQAA